MKTSTYRDIPIYEDYGRFYIFTDLGNVLKRHDFASLADAQNWIDSVLPAEDKQ